MKKPTAVSRFISTVRRGMQEPNHMMVDRQGRTYWSQGTPTTGPHAGMSGTRDPFYWHAQGWIEGNEANTFQEGSFASDLHEPWLTFVRTAWLRFSEGSDEVRRLTEEEPGAPSRLSRIPWSAVSWVRLTSRSSLSPGVMHAHSELFANSTDPNVVEGYFVGGEYFALIGNAGQFDSTDRWFHRLRAKGVKVVE